MKLKELTLKLMGPFTLTSGQRYQTLVNLDVECMKKTQGYDLFQLTEHMKQSRPGNMLDYFYVRKYHQQELCVIQHQNIIFSKRCHSDNLDTQSYCSHMLSLSSVGTSTAGHWIKTLLELSGIHMATFKVHSTHLANISKASQTVSVDTILKYVG